MTTSLLDVWSMARHEQLFTTLGRLEPAYVRDLLHRLRQAEVVADRRAALGPCQVVDDVRSNLGQAPRIRDRFAVDAIAADHDRYLETRDLDSLRLLIFARQIERALPLVDVGNIDVLGRCLEAGKGAVVLPFHIGPYLSAVPLIAYHHPVTTLMEAAAAEHAGAVAGAFLPPLDIETIGMPDRAVLLRCSRSLHANRVVCLFPEFSHGVDQPTTKVPFLGTEVFAPAGPGLLAQRIGSPLLTCVTRRTDTGIIRLDFSGPHHVAPGRRGIEEASATVFALLEQAVLAAPAEWWCWQVFEQMLTGRATQTKPREKEPCHEKAPA